MEAGQAVLSARDIAAPVETTRTFREAVTRARAPRVRDAGRRKCLARVVRGQLEDVAEHDLAVLRMGVAESFAAGDPIARAALEAAVVDVEVDAGAMGLALTRVDALVASANGAVGRVARRRPRTAGARAEPDLVFGLHRLARDSTKPRLEGAVLVVIAGGGVHARTTCVRRPAKRNAPRYATGVVREIGADGFRVGRDLGARRELARADADRREDEQAPHSRHSLAVVHPRGILPETP